VFRDHKKTRSTILLSGILKSLYDIIREMAIVASILVDVTVHIKLDYGSL